MSLTNPLHRTISDRFSQCLRSRGAGRINVEFYIFGSSSLSCKLKSDLDVLIVYPHIEALKVAKAIILNGMERFQIDLICMTDQEVEETNFIVAQDCQLLIL